MKDVGILLQKCDVGSVLNRLGIEYERRKSKRGYELYFHCFTNNHQDDSGKLRMSISESGKYKGMFNCWACGAHGNLIHMIRSFCKISFNDAVAFLEDEYGSSEVLGIDGLKFRLKMFKECDEEHPEIKELQLPVDFQLLHLSDGFDAKNALTWLLSERNINEEAIERFQIGWAWHSDLGKCITIPIYFKGIIASIFYAQPWKGGKKRFPKNSPQGLIFYNYDACHAERECIVMESILDVIKFWCVTGMNSMASFTNMISEEQLKLLTDFDVHGVMPDLDGKRGWDLVQRMVPMCGKNLWLYFVPIGKDPGDCTPRELITAYHQRIRYCDYETSQFIQRNVLSQRKILHIDKK